MREKFSLMLESLEGCRCLSAEQAAHRDALRELKHAHNWIADLNVSMTSLREELDSINSSDDIRQRHAQWSEKTFGNVGPIGPLKHLSAEALEAAECVSDLTEWADMQFLLWDAQRRAGITDDQIISAMKEKLTVNMARKWPEPKDGEPRMHVKPGEVEMTSAISRGQFQYALNALNDCLIDCGDSEQGLRLALIAAGVAEKAIKLPKRYGIAEMSRNPFESYRCIEEDEDGEYLNRDEVIESLKAHGLTVEGE